MNNRNIILGTAGLTLFFLVMSVLYILILATQNTPDSVFAPFIPFIVLTGFFIFLTGAFLFAWAIFKAIEKRFL